MKVAKGKLRVNGIRPQHPMMPGEVDAGEI